MSLDETDYTEVIALFEEVDANAIPFNIGIDFDIDIKSGNNMRAESNFVGLLNQFVFLINFIIYY
jgi:hypothetical protein